MSDLIQDILEKFKKVEGGPLDPQWNGDGSEDDFIGKHIDNVDVYNDPALEKTKGHPHDAGTKAKTVDRKKDRKGYMPGEDAEVYETADFTNMETLSSLSDNVDLLSEDDYYSIIEEAVTEFLEEDADEEERALLGEILSNHDQLQEMLEYIFTDITEEGDCEYSDEPVKKEKKGKKELVNLNPKTAKVATTDEEVERAADFKMTKVRTPTGKVVYQKVRKMTAVSKGEKLSKERDEK
jgi:hypothetical protein